MTARLDGILIGGTSHVGKSTLAKKLAEMLGCKVISTDDLARHPGRPFPQVRPQVAEYYARLSDETIHWFLKVHHENMWPGIERRVSDEIGIGNRFVFEGSALRPEYIANIVCDTLPGVCLHGDSDFLRERIREEAEYQTLDTDKRAIIDKFIERSLRDNSDILESAQKHGLRTINICDNQASNAFLREVERLANESGNQVS